MQKLDAVDAPSLRDDIPPFPRGRHPRCVKVIEGNRSRIQVFQGVASLAAVWRVSSTFTIRKEFPSVWASSVLLRLRPTIDVEVVCRATCACPKLTACVASRQGRERSENTRPARPSEASGPRVAFSRKGPTPAFGVLYSWMDFEE